MELKKLNPDLQKDLQKIADEKEVTIISFVAPQDPVRTSPVTIASAAIQEKEMYKLEEAVEKSQSDNLHLIIQTPGGELHTSFKIASFLRSKFKNIQAFVPYQAASGGTLICCAANSLSMGDFANLTPIDPQVRYAGSWVSAYSLLRFVKSFETIYGQHSPGEVPSPWQQMADKLDPIIHDEMNTSVFTTTVYAYRLLRKSGYSEEKAATLAVNLGRTMYTHSFAILGEEAAEIGFNLVKEDETIRIYRRLVAERMQERVADHCIDTFYPRIPASVISKTKTTSKNERNKKE